MTTVANQSRPRKAYDLVSANHDYPDWHGAPRRTILICTHPRSGSTLLGEALYFAGGLGCPLEYCHAGFRPAIEARWQTSGTAAYLDALRRHRTDQTGTLSIKLFWRDMQELAADLDQARFAELATAAPEAVSAETYRALADLLAPFFPHPAFLHLERRDRVRQAVSALSAIETGLWRSIPGVGEQEPIAEPGFDFERIERLIAYSDFCHGHWRNFFAAIGATPHALSYEDLANDHDATALAALRHLGSTASPPPVRMRRQSDGRSEAMVLRFLREHAVRAGR
jgi:LPS sulfotransferase NodH